MAGGWHENRTSEKNENEIAKIYTGSSGILRWGVADSEAIWKVKHVLIQITLESFSERE